MKRLTRLVREIHRRSLWQVLAIYLASSWVALQVVNELTRTAGLPDWVPPAALALLVVGFPVVMATAVVQEGGPVQTQPEGEPDPPPPDPGGSEADGTSLQPARGSPHGSFIARQLTWKRAILGGVIAFSLLFVAVAGYFVMRVAGIGPAASLVAQGVMEDGEPIVLADFRNATNDPLLASVVTQALRMDLAASPTLRVVEAPQVQGALRRMGRDPNSELTASLAREVAVRDGVKAVLEGEIGAAGSGFILSAALRRAEDGATLATFRGSARSADGVVEAIDRLSRDIREKAGESLRSIRSGGTLSQVTTGSLEALRRYTEAELLSDQGREAEALAPLEEAVELDPEFAMAWRKIGVVLGNLGQEPERRSHAIEQAHRLRDRLTPVERYLAEAMYHSVVSEDREAAIRAYRNVLRVDPDHSTALNNLGLQLMQTGQLEEAEEILVRAAALPEPTASAFVNLMGVRMFRGEMAAAREALGEHRERFPADPRHDEIAFTVHALSLDGEGAERALREAEANPDLPPSRRAGLALDRAVLDAYTGRIAAAREAILEVARGPEVEASAAAPLGAAWLDAWWYDDLERAGAVLLDALARAPPDPPGARGVYLEWGARLHLVRGDLDGAQAWLDRWSETQPDADLSPFGLRTREFLESWAAGVEGDPDALVTAAEALARDPTCAACTDEFIPPLLEQVGRTREARDAWQGLVGRRLSNRPFSIVLVPLALREAGRLSEALGETDGAAATYRQLLGIWADPGPEMRPFVDRIRARVEALEAGLGQS